MAENLIEMIVLLCAPKVDLSVFMRGRISLFGSVVGKGKHWSFVNLLGDLRISGLALHDLVELPHSSCSVLAEGN